MELFPLQELETEHNQRGALYYEFLRKSTMSLGVYKLSAGTTDPQQPHAEDEVYYVLAGRAQAFVSGATRAIGPGDTLFVGAREEHRFQEITEDLSLLVFFAPSESE